MMRFIKRIFIWWEDSTIGTWLFTFRKGEEVGKDDSGNVYYRSKKSGPEERRWVIYNGSIEASRVPPEWHCWLHKTVDQPPSLVPPLVQDWEKDHLPNQTGSKGAYFPPGSPISGGEREAATGDYEAWKP